jgi:hypothetical protein
MRKSPLWLQEQYTENYVLRSYKLYSDFAYTEQFISKILNIPEFELSRFQNMMTGGW